MFRPLLLCLLVSLSASDPYATLGVSRTATTAEIKRAYRQLAKEWHPDKNKDPAGEETFIRINAAYELLSNEERRKNYDLYGTTDTNGPRAPPSSSQSFHSFFSHRSGSRFTFNFGDEDFRFFHSSQEDDMDRVAGVSLRQFETFIWNETKRKPYLLLVTSAWCWPCMEIEPIWRQAAKELSGLGFGVGGVSNDFDPDLVRRLGVHKMPTLVLVIDQRIWFYREDFFQVQTIRQFVQKAFPSDLIISLKTRESTAKFLSRAAEENKPRVVLVSDKKSVPLLYQVVAFEHRHTTRFVFVSLLDSFSSQLLHEHQLNTNQPALLFFKEYSDTPVEVQSVRGLKGGELKQLVERHRFLHVPRLTSMPIMTELCSLNRLCVILLWNVQWTGTTQLPGALDHFVKLAQSYMSRANAGDADVYQRDVQFVQIDTTRQHLFVESLEKARQSDVKRDHCSAKEGTASIVLMRRLSLRKVNIAWYQKAWCDGSAWSQQMKDLEMAIRNVRHYTRTFVPELEDEERPGLLEKLRSYASYRMDNIWLLLNSAGPDQLYTVFLLVIPTLIILLSQLLLPKSLESRREPEKNPLRSSSRSPKRSTINLTSSSYEQVFSIPAGHLFFLLATNEAPEGEGHEGSQLLLRAFEASVQPYRRYRNLHFGYVVLSSQKEWCGAVTAAVADCAADSLSTSNGNRLRWHPGTVIAVNVHKHYLSVFSTESVWHEHQSLNSSQSSSGRQWEDVLGLNDEPTASPPMDQLFLKAVEEVRTSLPVWIDKLIDGRARRLRVKGWPRL